MKEEWRDINGYEGYYQVSNLGKIWSKKTNRILSHHSDSNTGYCRLILRRNGKNIGCLVHRLVAEAFIDNPYNKPEVNHLDEDKTNNNMANLEWCTKLENENWGTKRERCVKNTNYELIAEQNRKPVNQYTLDGILIRTWRTANDCKRKLGYDNSSIAKCCNGKLKTAYGYRWGYCG